MTMAPHAASGSAPFASSCAGGGGSGVASGTMRVMGRFFLVAQSNGGDAVPRRPLSLESAAPAAPILWRSDLGADGAAPSADGDSTRTAAVNSRRKLRAD